MGARIGYAPRIDVEHGHHRQHHFIDIEPEKFAASAIEWSTRARWL